MSITPDSWDGVTPDTFDDAKNRYTDFSEVDPPRIWTFPYTGSSVPFEVPSGVTKLKVECLGGGGRISAVSVDAGHGGGGGSYASSVVEVTPESTLTVTVGGGAGSGSQNGQDSTVIGSGIEIRGAGAQGRLARPENCVGDTIYSGGHGGERSANSGAGGGGGGSAGRLGPGSTGENGHSAGSGGRGGLSNDASSEWKGRGGAGGRKAVVGQLGQPGQEGQPGEPEIPPQTISTTYHPTWSRSWYNFGIHHWSPLLLQGDPQQDNVGFHYGKIGFNDSQIRSDLSGTSNNSIRLRLTNQHSWWASGLNPGRFGAHNNTNQPTGSTSTDGSFNVVTQFFNRGETRWVSLPTTWISSFRGGSIRGITVGRTNAGNRDDYGYFSGYNANTSQRPLLEITYTIPGQPGTPSEPGTPGTPEVPGMIGTAGRNGRFPGGGGGGSGWNPSGSLISGNGAHGYIRITEVT